jgi:hypothetical protein
MVLNKDYNPEDEWEVVSDEGTPDQVQPRSDVAAASNVVTEAATVETAAAVSVAQEEKQQAQRVDDIQGDALGCRETDQQEPLEVAPSKAEENNSVKTPIVMEQADDNVIEPTKNVSVEESVEHATSNEQEPLLPPESTTSESMPEATTGSTASNEEQQQQEQQHSTKRPASVGWLSESLNKIEQVIKEADAKHHIQQKARNSVKAVGDSITKIGDSIQKEASAAKAVLDRESVRLTKTVQEKADQVEWHKKTKVIETKAMETAAAVEAKATHLRESVKTTAVSATEKVKTTAVQAGEKVKTLNKDGKVTGLLAAAAVIGGAILVARGKPGAGAAMMATGGAAFAAGEAAKEARLHDEGLNEDLHMD